ncbi:MAG: hypothetical protein ABIL09_20700 [Gemmatimonadota bacterium]
MRCTVRPARKLAGEVRVPGEREAAAEALVLAALAEGQSAVAYTPPAVAPLAGALGALGVRVEPTAGGWVVTGSGLRGFGPVEGVLDLSSLEGASLLALALLAGQSFASHVRPGAPREQVMLLAQHLAAAGAAVVEEAEGVYRVDGGGALKAVDHADAELPAAVKLALLVAGLYADGDTCVREPIGSRDRVDQRLRLRGVEVVGSRQEDPPQRLMTVTGGQALVAGAVEVAGDLDLAMPVVVAATSVRGSEVTVRQVAVRAETRIFVDLLRQVGASVEIAESGDGVADVVSRFGRPKATRVAEKRAERLLRHVPLLAVLATQAEGEFILRDIESLRGGEYDYVTHLVAMLRRLGAKVGEYPEGIVIDGGQPLVGAEVDARGDAAMVQAFAVAGLFADGEVVIEGAEGVDHVFPGFFESLGSVTQERKR